MSIDEEKRVFFCRACMTECFDYKDLHKKGLICEEITTLANLLEFCTNLEFPENERSMPGQICSPCMKTLIKSARFKKMVIENDKYLRKIASPAPEEEQKQEVNKENEIKKNNTEKDEERKEDEVEERLQEQEQDGEEDQEEDHQEITIPISAVSEETVEVEDKIHSGKIEFITNELEDGNEFFTLHYMRDGDVIETEALHSQDSTSSETRIIQESHDQYEIQYIETDNDQIDIGVDEVIEDGLHEDIIEDYEDDENMGQNSSESDILHFIKEESESADSYSISVDDDNSQTEKHFIFDKGAIAKKRHTSENEILSSGGIEIDFDKIRANKEKNPKYQCKICGKQLSNAGSYKYHMQLHSDKTPYLCSLCGEGFKTRNAYDGHLSTHDPNNPNTCNICGKKYRQASSLRAHMVVHTGEKPFQCEICGKGLTQKSGYKKHLLTHTNEKPHCCDVCGREFRYSSNYLAHKRTHDTTRKMYKCGICNKAFNSMDHLKKHKQNHGQSMPFQCNACPERFKTFESMESHRQAKHLIFDTKVSRSNIVEML